LRQVVWVELVAHQAQDINLSFFLFYRVLPSFISTIQYEIQKTIPWI